MAGSGKAGYRDGIGSNAQFSSPETVVCTSDGSKVVVADWSNHRLRLIHTATNEVVTIAGNGEDGHSDGEALAVSLECPNSLAFDRTTFSPDSVLYITCSWRLGLLRRFDFSYGLLCLCAGGRGSLRFLLLLHFSGSTHSLCFLVSSFFFHTALFLPLCYALHTQGL